MREEDDPLLVSGPGEEEDDEHQEIGSNGRSLIRRTWLESKRMWVIAGPSIFSRVAMYSITVITQAFAGHLGDLELAAISIATTVIIAISFGLLVKTPTLYTPFGCREKEKENGYKCLTKETHFVTCNHFLNFFSFLPENQTES
ncbi:hypothetical protein L1049_026578 [Liquidambar formosana]|uniref:Uncharacterized protein n=1 Tax=Liquidambar formosana TaxID=63359 RepID=A0AAP0R6J3_LIQFO